MCLYSPSPLFSPPTSLPPEEYRIKGFKWTQIWTSVNKWHDLSRSPSRFVNIFDNHQRIEVSQKNVEYLKWGGASVKEKEAERGEGGKEEGEKEEED